MNRKIGLVLAGGGGKGAYQIGVWKALKEFGIDKNISTVSGTSVGAMNMLLFAQGNYEIAEDVWINISSDDILNIDAERIVNHLPNRFKSRKIVDFFKSHGLFSREGLINIMDRYINFDSIYDLDMFATCSDVTDYPPGIREISAFTNCVVGKKFGKETYFKLNNYSTDMIKKILLASSALPFIFDTEEIEGKIYYDGGLCDNVPIKPVYDVGCKVIFVIHLNRTRVIDHDKFPDAQILEIVPQDEQGGTIKGTLDFTTDGAMRRIEQGYNDTIRIIKPIYEMGITQYKLKKTLYNLHEDELRFKTKHIKVLQEREDIKAEMKVLLDSTKIGGNE
ncbi:patatin-like phospholipase family protein [Brassicibacter mesophilus]|uniref:patatin-like phospholipase family protein n=1 Tax=Brassicibacter mesophilus TaxID=745119 RepID=UPI003D22723C